MRNLLQNKLVVAGLVVLALALVGWRVMGFMGKGSASITAREPAKRLVLPEQLAKPVELVSESGLRLALAGWPELFPKADLSRDPFAAPPAAPGALPEVSTEGLVLRAISIEPESVLIIINHDLYTEGQAVGEFFIEKILPTEVWLKHPRGRSILRLPRDPVQANDGSKDSTPQK